MPTMLKLPKSLLQLPDLTRVEESLCEKGYANIAGVDEAGRGPLAGPVVAAAVILPVGVTIEGIADSKKLSPKRRDILFDEIVQSGAMCSVGVIDHATIDKINILKASLMAMRKAVATMETCPDFVLVDGSFTIPHLDIPQLSIVGGDNICTSISAASIIAKVMTGAIVILNVNI